MLCLCFFRHSRSLYIFATVADADTRLLFFVVVALFSEEKSEEKKKPNRGNRVYTSFVMLAVHILWWWSSNSNFLSMICRQSCIDKYSHTNRWVDCSILLPSNSNRYTFTDGFAAASAAAAVVIYS